MRSHPRALVAVVVIGITACGNHQSSSVNDGAVDLSASDSSAPEGCDGACGDVDLGVVDDMSVPMLTAHLTFDAAPAKADIGASVALVVTVHNDGTAPATQLVVSTAPTAPYAFTGGSYPGTGGSCGASLNNGDSCAVNLTFTPTAAGAANGQWTLGYFDGVGAKSLTVSLAAVGLRAGTLDPGFGNAGQQVADFSLRPVTNAYYGQVAVQADGKILVSGVFNSSQTSQIDNCFVARFLPGGQLDTGFGTGGTVDVHGGNNSCAIGGIVVLGDGHILIGGQRDTAALFAMRLNSDGSLDPTFGRSGIGTIGTNSLSTPAAMVIRAGGQILLGAATVSNGYALGQLHSDGTVDTSFGTSGLATGSGGVPAFATMTVDANDEILIGGRDSYYISSHFYVGRLTANGTFDKAFTTPLLYNSSTAGIAVSLFATGNQVYAAGYANGTGAVPVVVRFFNQGSVGSVDAGANDGTADTSFNGTGVLAIDNIGTDGLSVVSGARWSGTDFYLTGHARSAGQDDSFIAHYNLDGSADSTFGTDGVFLHDFDMGDDDDFSNVAVTASALFAAGSADTGSLVRLSPKGALDSTFVASTALTVSGGGYINNDSDQVLGVDVQSGGQIIVSGAVYSHNPALIRFNSDGSLDNAFGVSGRQVVDMRGSFAAASTIGGNILVAGNDASAHLLLARLHASDGSLDGSFHSAGLSTVLFSGVQTNSLSTASAVILPDGSAYVGGSAHDTGTSSYEWILARFQADGSPDSGFNGSGALAVTPSGSGDQLSQIAVDASGRLLVAGLRGNQANLIRYDSHGVADPGFNGGNLLQPTVNADYASSAAIAIAGTQIWLAVTVGSSGASGKIGHDGGDCVLMRFSDAGVLDSGFQTAGQLVLNWGGADTCRRVAVTPDGKLLIAGVSSSNGTSSQVLTRLNMDGTLDASFGAAGITITSTADLHDCALTLGSDGIYTASTLLNVLYGYQLDLMRYLN